MQISSWLQTTFTSMLLLVISCQSEIACCHWLASWHALIASIAKRGRNHSVYGIDILFISFQILLVCPFLALFLLVSSCFLYLFFFISHLSCIFILHLQDSLGFLRSRSTNSSGPFWDLFPLDLQLRCNAVSETILG